MSYQRLERRLFRKGERRLRYVFSVIAYAFEVDRYVHEADDDAQVLAERLVARSEFHAASVDFLFELVYQVAVVDDLLRELSVVVLERPDGLLHGLGRHAAHAVDHIFQGPRGPPPAFFSCLS